ncbi:uncharacterized protein Triagg1_5658 [Trichoderma aggressivum f. europaeum]|uniref:Uncharacterized protein n=1 Tax=Trichoderma aggressivum f. europaeum TaxID=173218 RepID=A0AAE1ICW7_9HYPO|nr:hypothetical protein Triagg1_5658 [Trichoderma aggressivum f. europaeum]
MPVALLVMIFNVCSTDQKPTGTSVAKHVTRILQRGYSASYGLATGMEALLCRVPPSVANGQDDIDDSDSDARQLLFPRGAPYKEIRSHKDGAALAPSLPTAGPLRQSLGIVEMQLVVMAGDSEV